MKSPHLSTVLVVDDAPDIRDLMRTVLEYQGFTVCEAESGQAALDVLAAGPMPDLAVVDVQMPDLDGWGVLSGVRRDPACAGVPVILCTVKSGREDLLRAWALGADGYLNKPFAIDDLVVEAWSVLHRTPDQRDAIRRTRYDDAFNELVSHS